MKTQKIIIQIRSLDQVLDDFVEVGTKIKRGEKVCPKKGTYVADVDTARAIFTDGRLRIVQVLKEKSPQSIYELAKILKRDFKNVYNDIHFLVQLGIVRIDEKKTGRREKNQCSYQTKYFSKWPPRSEVRPVAPRAWNSTSLGSELALKFLQPKMKKLHKLFFHCFQIT